MSRRWLATGASGPSPAAATRGPARENKKKNQKKNKTPSRWHNKKSTTVDRATGKRRREASTSGANLPTGPQRPRFYCPPHKREPGPPALLDSPRRKRYLPRPATWETGMNQLRNARHRALEGFGPEGQARLEQGSALVIGLGGLGQPLSAYLAAAGVGRLVLADFDSVDEANLHRQPWFAPTDLGRDKLEAITERLREQNPALAVTGLRERLDESGLAEQLADVDVVADASDNFATRFAVNAACVARGVPLVSGAAIRWSGQLAVFRADQPGGSCYRCLFPETASSEMEDCAGSGVLSPLVGVIGAAQAVEAIKLLSGCGEPAGDRLLRYDAWTGEWRSARIRRDPDCPCCGERP